MKPITITRTGPKPGKTLAVFAGVHGNEIAGLSALRSLQNTLEIARGTVYFVEANPQAISQGVRYVEKNLNRCFTPDNTGQTYEDELARHLMPLLDQCDALLDLHGYNGLEDQPFLICEPNAFELTSRLNFSLVSTGWSSNEPGGTDGYMAAQGKIGICAECGSNLRADRYVPLATQTINQFLTFYDSLVVPEPLSDTDQRHVVLDQVIKKTAEDLQFTKEFYNFETLPAGEIFARMGSVDFRAKSGQCIIFPRPQAKLGEEAFILGKFTPKERAT